MNPDSPPALETYAIAHWAAGYFTITPQGHVAATPLQSPDNAIDLYELAQTLKREGMSYPVLVRFTDILKGRANSLRCAFDTACELYHYQGAYTPVYPIKVNQQRQVLEGILKGGSETEPVGLEAGSKPELLAILGVAGNRTVICNGYKDRTYIRLALIGIRLGIQLYIVIEKPSELALILEESKALGIRPQLGVRVRLSSISAGKWQNSGGEKSKFGLTANTLLQLVRQLEQTGNLDCLRLMHFHMGSQIANIRDIQTALREAGRHFAELHQLGVGITILDVGGGLGVDYEGSRSRSFSSMNYSLDEYAQNIVRAFSETCAEHGIPHPQIITEAGRAMTAHHAVLISNVIEVEAPSTAALSATPPSASPLLQNLQQLMDNLDQRPILEIFHDAQFDLSEIRSLYVQGRLGLEELAAAETLASQIALAVRERLDLNIRAHRDLRDELNERLADKVFCNFSLFQSMPDAWGIGQVFPIMPLHRLDEPPSRRAVIQDLTCDSDGRINAYVDQQNIESTLPLHEPRPGEDYLLGFFLLGAYQEILGDMHNLFGDTHSVNIELDSAGGYRIVEPTRGDGVGDLLHYVHIEPKDLERTYQKRLAAADLSPQQRKQFANELISGLSAYTYLED